MCSQERKVSWADPQREQDEREAKGRTGDKPTTPTSHPTFTAAFTLQQTFRKLLENEMQEKKIDDVFV